MLVNSPKNTESKPAWRFLQFFGLENSRESASANAKNRPTKEPEERKHQFATWYIFAAFLGLMLIQYLWLRYTQVETIPYSQIRAAARSEQDLRSAGRVGYHPGHTQGAVS
jgi:cell division protease FtsH